MREIVVLAADLPDEATPGLALEYDYRTGDADLDATALEVRQLRRQADELPLQRLPAPARPPRNLWSGACPSAMSLPCWASAPQRVSQLTARAS